VRTAAAVQQHGAGTRIDVDLGTRARLRSNLPKKDSAQQEEPGRITDGCASISTLAQWRDDRARSSARFDAPRGMFVCA
jgi:hypothetical protein